ncbi:zinc finger protein 595-like [Ochlerotatus camptorhynchus]|uniref:zinc finger protein 595-like n=1 Tax=Ochlerotatus camptorhynchus TaxID=644619 RepID=UPI0031D3AD9E
MPCCIDQCPPGKFGLVKFPPSLVIQTRWRDAIKAGTGTTPSALSDLKDPWSKNALGKMKRYNATGAQLDLEICLGHFPDPNDRGYQDPTVFVNRTGKRVDLTCCRLCHRFESTSQMYSLDGKISGQHLNEAILQTMKIRLKQEEDPRFLSICHSCLVKVDLVKVIQNKYLILAACHGCFLQEQTPLELVEPAVNNMVIGEEMIIKEEGLSEETIVKDEKMKANMGDKTVQADTQLVIKLEEQGEVKVDESDAVKPKKRVVVKRKVEDKVHQISTLKTIRLRTVAAKTCYICPTVLADAEHLLAHLTEKHAGKIDYICPHCDGKQLKTVLSYNGHLSLHDSSGRPLQCNFCTLRYSTRKGLEVHETRAHGAPRKHQPQKKRNRQIQCEHCGKVFNSTSSIQEHKLVVHQQGIAAQCKICLKAFSHKSNLNRHMLTHTGEHPYKCDTCGLQFKIVTDLNKHVQSDHEGKMPYYCFKCNLPLKDKNAYQRHRTQHKFKQGPAKRTFRCGLCPITFESPPDLQAHIDEQHPSQDYPYTPCPFCSDKFVTPNQMHMHKYTKHCDQRTSRSTKLLCTICGDQQRTRYHLDSHMTKVHGAEKKYACKLCDSRFTIERNLIRHQDLHKEVKKFACEFCAKSFHQKVAMENHRRSVHTGEKAFECEGCGKGFKETSMYYRHKATCMEKQDAE